MHHDDTTSGWNKIWLATLCLCAKVNSDIRSHDTYLQPIQNCFLAFFIEPIDKPVVVELFDERHVGEVFGLCGADLGIFLAELG